MEKNENSRKDTPTDATGGLTKEDLIMLSTPNEIETDEEVTATFRQGNLTFNLPTTTYSDAFKKWNKRQEEKK